MLQSISYCCIFGNFYYLFIQVRADQERQIFRYIIDNQYKGMTEE